MSGETEQRTKVLRVATRCVSIEQFVEAFARYCQKRTLYIASMTTRAPGSQSPFVILLADGSQAMRGTCEVVEAWATPSGPFRRPGVRVKFLQLDAASEAVLGRLHAFAPAPPPIPKPPVLPPLPPLRTATTRIPAAPPVPPAATLPSTSLPALAPLPPRGPVVPKKTTMAVPVVPIPSASASGLTPVPAMSPVVALKPARAPSPQRIATIPPLVEERQAAAPVAPQLEDEPKTDVDASPDALRAIRQTVEARKPESPFEEGDHSFETKTSTEARAEPSDTEPPSPGEERAPGSPIILPANPLADITDDNLRGFVECTLYEETGKFSFDDLLERTGGDDEDPIVEPPLPPELKPIGRRDQTPVPRRDQTPVPPRSLDFDDQWDDDEPNVKHRTPPPTPAAPVAVARVVATESGATLSPVAAAAPPPAPPPMPAINVAMSSAPLPAPPPQPVSDAAHAAGDNGHSVNHPSSQPPPWPQGAPPQWPRAATPMPTADGSPPPWAQSTAAQMAPAFPAAMASASPSARLGSVPEAATAAAAPEFHLPIDQDPPEPPPQPRRGPLIVGIVAAALVSGFAVFLVMRGTNKTTPPQAAALQTNDKAPRAGTPDRGTAPATATPAATLDIDAGAAAPAAVISIDAGTDTADTADDTAEDTTDTTDTTADTTEPPPIPDEPAAGTGDCTLEVVTTPDGAKVRAAGRTYGKSPLTINLPCGRTKIALERSRYEEIEKTVNLTAGSPGSLKVVLERPEHTLKLASTPGGATVSIDGKKVGTTPTTVTVPGFQTLRVEMRRAGYKTLRTTHYSRRNRDVLATRLQKGT